MAPSDAIETALKRLGFAAPSVRSDELTSSTAALACLPMYMVAGCHAWTADSQWKMPLTDIPGFEAIREAFAIGRQEKKFDISPEDRAILGGFLQTNKPADRIVYDFALDTLADYLTYASRAVADQVRTAVARMIVAVAKASGEGLLGTGEKINRFEVACINEIATKLDLRSVPAAAEHLKPID